MLEIEAGNGTSYYDNVTELSIDYDEYVLAQSDHESIEELLETAPDALSEAWEHDYHEVLQQEYDNIALDLNRQYGLQAQCRYFDGIPALLVMESNGYDMVDIKGIIKNGEFPVSYYSTIETETNIERVAVFR